jgi:hypothetical protein
MSINLSMKLFPILLAPNVAVGMASTPLARDDKDLVAEGYDAFPAHRCERHSKSGVVTAQPAPGFERVDL